MISPTNTYHSHNIRDIFFHNHVEYPNDVFLGSFDPFSRTVVASLLDPYSYLELNKVCPFENSAKKSQNTKIRLMNAFEKLQGIRKR